MARNKQTARRSTGGRAPRKQLATCCPLGHRGPPAPQIRGPWYEIRPGARDHVRDPNDASLVVLPSFKALDFHDQDVEDERSLAEERSIECMRPNSQDMDHFTWATKDHSALINLSTEILVQILSTLVYEGRVFYLSPTNTEAGVYKNKPKATSIYQAAAASDRWSSYYDTEFDPFPRVRSLALTCRRLRDVAYDISYGRNQFIIGLAVAPLTTHVHGPDSRQSRKREVWHWNRSIGRTPRLQPWPLSVNTMS